MRCNKSVGFILHIKMTGYLAWKPSQLSTMRSLWTVIDADDASVAQEVNRILWSPNAKFLVADGKP